MEDQFDKQYNFDTLVLARSAAVIEQHAEEKNAEDAKEMQKRIDDFAY